MAVLGGAGRVVVVVVVAVAAPARNKVMVNAKLCVVKTVEWQREGGGRAPV
jgi:hypothetical protein